ncbi:hypothetical protein NR798_11460 [Archangium gephyra]|uniref:hypothetical protein n=1 Tax=Archangium gephyra TaxID=48 RepID=UPI0035D4F1EB
MTPIRLALLVASFLFLHGSAARAQAYERARPSGIDLCRSSRTFTYALAVSEGHPTSEERAAIEAAVETWRQAASTCSDLVFERAADVTEGKLTTGGSTVISFRPRACKDVVPDTEACWAEYSCGEKYNCWSHGSSEIAETGLIFKTDTGEILGGLIELDASLGTLTTADGSPCARGSVTPGCVGHDVQGLMTRSIGEALGFALLARTDSTMTTSLSWGDTRKRVLDAGTLEGLCALYPRGQPTPGCVSASPPPDPAPETPPKGGCDASASGPLLGAAVLLLRAIRRPRRSRGAATRA